MPANLPPEYYKLKHELEAARTDEERLQILEEMTRITPKHKGTEKVRADLRSRIAKLRKSAGKKQSKKGHSYHVPKQGAGQLVLIGTLTSVSLKLLPVLPKRSRVFPNAVYDSGA